MITLEALLAASKKGKVYLHFHINEYTLHIWRQNGVIKTWKTRPGCYKMPIKHGMYSFSYLADNNCTRYYLADECPICNKKD